MRQLFDVQFHHAHGMSVVYRHVTIIIIWCIWFDLIWFVLNGEQGVRKIEKEERENYLCEY
jgi:hypothetical protein